MVKDNAGLRQHVLLRGTRPKPMLSTILYRTQQVAKAKAVVHYFAFLML
jgi:hypothetical protein